MQHVINNFFYDDYKYLWGRLKNAYGTMGVKTILLQVAVTTGHISFFLTNEKLLFKTLEIIIKYADDDKCNLKKHNNKQQIGSIIIDIYFVLL